MSLLSVFLGREICGMPDWPGCDHFGQYDAVMNSDDIEAFVDKHAEEFLKDELAVLPTGFRAIGVPGDGNCLAHAVSKSCLGIELLYHAMRQELQNELREQKEWYWKKCIPFFDEESATEFIESAAREAVPTESSDGCHGMAEFLGPIHIHAMANVLRRPIVLMAARTLWEQSLSGVYLPERKPPNCWTKESCEAVLSSATAVTEDPAFESSALCTPFRDWLDKVSKLPDPLDFCKANLEDWARESEAIGSLCDDLLSILRECVALPDASELEGKAWKVLQAISAARRRTPIFIAWASAALAHFVCLLPSSPGGVLTCQKMVIPREAMPQRDGVLTILGEPEEGLSREDSAKLYLEGGQFAVRGHIWPNRERFLEKVEVFWKKDHPKEDFQEAVLEKGWSILLPNILNNVLDIAQLFKSLNVEDDDDPVWLYVSRTRLLVPRRIEQLAFRLPYLRDVLLQASDRMRPIWINTPDESTNITQGEEFTIEWGTISRISGMVEKKTGIKLEQQMVEIGWMYAGTGSFHANIARAVPFHTRKHVWKVPDNMEPRNYWIAVRLIPFDKTQMEGAGPPQGSFQVLRRATNATELPTPMPRTEQQCEKSDTSEENPQVASTSKDEMLWEFRENGVWKEFKHDITVLLTEAHKANKKEMTVEFEKKKHLSVDFEQMKIKLGLREFAIRKNGEFQVNEASLETLVKDMGFSEDDARKALETCRNDVEMASNYLLNCIFYEVDAEDDPRREDIQPNPAPLDPVDPETDPTQPKVIRTDAGNQAKDIVPPPPHKPVSAWGDDDDFYSPARDPGFFEDLRRDISTTTSSGEDTQGRKLPDFLQPMFVKEAVEVLRSDGPGDAPVREIDVPIPVRDLRKPAMSSMPQLDKNYLKIMENEARTWELKGESLWQKVEEEIQSRLDQEQARPPPSLQRLNSACVGPSSEKLETAPPLTRMSSAPAVMSGLSRHQWATLFYQARNLYKPGK